MELYHFLNKRSLCKSSLESKRSRYCSEPDLLNLYWSELFPGEAVHMARSGKICDECYFAFQKLKKQSASVNLDSDFKFTVLFGNHFPDTCNDHVTAIDCALHCTMSFCIYNVELFAFFLNNALIFILTAEVAPLKHQRNLTNGLLSCLNF